jgi:hypothetical protein
MKRVTAFSNGTEFMAWKYKNCDQCDRYENTSRTRSQAKCNLAFDIDFASVSDGKIPLLTALLIGCDKDYNLNRKCSKNSLNPAKYDFSNMNQLNLFKQ